ncbi:MAG: hypothetical protein JWM96_82 [Alphaproteobacteria bacterium]|nr:hypothetical protein [Alphaproteobacteria bacterium]
MTLKQKIRAYSASFRMGVKLCLSDRADLFSTVLIYGTLLVVFDAIYRVMPIEQLGRADITRAHLLWYFVTTEIIVVSVQGYEREFGRLIAEGMLTTMLQRPGNMMGLLLTRIFGTVFMNSIFVSGFALCIAPLLTGTGFPVPPVFIPLFILSVFMGVVIFLLTGYCVGMLEILGPYSRPFNWMVNKLIFTFGGLFFPVIFFPKILQVIVHFTPCPAVISVPGNFMLNPTWAQVRQGLLEQILWVFIMAVFAAQMEKRLITRVLVKGD